MSERTLTQITKEIEQAAKRISEARMSLKSAQDDLTSLLRERGELEAEMLAGTGYTIRVVGERDNHPVETPKRTRTPRAQQATGEVSAKVLKDWAASENWTFNNEAPSKYPKRLPEDMRAALLEAYNSAHMSL